MGSRSKTHLVRDRLASYDWSGDAIRSRSVSDVVLSGVVDVPALRAGGGRLDAHARSAVGAATSDVALVACRGASYHHDGAQYGGAAFCNLFLSEDRRLDSHFPSTGQRTPLVRGAAVISHTGQPHAVIERRSSGLNVADFTPEQDCTQVFLTWVLPIENVEVGQALRIACDIDPSTSSRLEEEQLWRNGARASVCPDSGRWCQTD